jgi:hypothetical protein
MFIVSYLHTFHVFFLIAALSYAGRSFTLMAKVRSLQDAVGSLELGMRNCNVYMLCHLFLTSTQHDAF